MNTNMNGFYLQNLGLNTLKTGIAESEKKEINRK